MVAATHDLERQRKVNGVSGWDDDDDDDEEEVADATADATPDAEEVLFLL